MTAKSISDLIAEFQPNTEGDITAQASQDIINSNLNLVDGGTLQANIDMGSHDLTNVTNITSASEAVNVTDSLTTPVVSTPLVRCQVADLVLESDFNDVKFVTDSGNVNFNSNNITGLNNVTGVGDTVTFTSNIAANLTSVNSVVFTDIPHSANATLAATTLGSSITVEMPNVSGTLALTSDIVALTLANVLDNGNDAVGENIVNLQSLEVENISTHDVNGDLTIYGPVVIDDIGNSPLIAGTYTWNNSYVNGFPIWSFNGYTLQNDGAGNWVLSDGGTNTWTKATSYFGGTYTPSGTASNSPFVHAASGIIDFKYGAELNALSLKLPSPDGTGFNAILQNQAIGSDQTFTFPTSGGTLAITADIIPGVPYTGASTSLDMGGNNVTAFDFIATDSIRSPNYHDGNAIQILTVQQPAIADADANPTVIVLLDLVTAYDDLATKFNTLLAELRTHGIIAT